MRIDMRLGAVICLVFATTLQAQTKAYVSHAGLVTVADTATNTILGTVGVDSGASQVAISKDGARAYALNPTPATISVIDVASDSVVNTVTVGGKPTAFAVTPDGAFVYVVNTAAESSGVQVFSLSTNANVATIPLQIGAGLGSIAITPDGTSAYVVQAGGTGLTTGSIAVIDTATNLVTATINAGLPLPPPPVVSVQNAPTNVILSPDGKQLYIGLVTYYTLDSTDPFVGGFSVGGGVAVVDTATNTQVASINIGGVAGGMALSLDGSRGYVCKASVWWNTGYGASAVPGRTVVVFDTTYNAMLGEIDLGTAPGGEQIWYLQNTGAGVAVTPDQSEVYVVIPRLQSVAVVPVNTKLVRQLIPLSTGSANGVAIVPADVPRVPYQIIATDDVAGKTLPTTAGGTAIKNVLVNDLLGGFAPLLQNVNLAQVSATNAGVSLDPLNGSVNIAVGTPAGTHSLVYQICEKVSPANCAEGTATVTVRARYPIHALGDNGTLPGPILVLGNDTLNNAPATLASVTVSQVFSSNAAFAVDSWGYVFIPTNPPPGTHTVVYQICEKEDPSNCDTASVSIFIPFPILAVSDRGTTNRNGGVVLNALANDTFNGAPATLAQVALTQLSSTNAGLTIDPGSGTVSVAAGTPAGIQALVYNICEIANPLNCSSANVWVTVTPYVIHAEPDSGTAMALANGTPVANVLANDTLGASPATLTNVSLTQVSVTPVTKQVRLNVLTGAVEAKNKATAGTYQLVYQICEIGTPTNCSQATATVILTPGAGGGGHSLP